MHKQIIKINAILLTFILLISIPLYIVLIRFTYNMLIGPEWNGRPFLSRLLSKDTIGLAASIVSIPVIFLLILYGITILFASQYGKTGIEITDDCLIIRYRIVPIVFKWKDISCIDYIEEEMKTKYRTNKRPLLKIYYKNVEVNNSSIIKKYLRVLAGLRKSPFVIYEDWMFDKPGNMIFNMLINKHEYYKKAENKCEET